MSDDRIVSEHHALIEDTAWPINLDDMAWNLRYGAETNMLAASAVDAYRYLVNPSLPQYAAIDALKRARRAAALEQTIEPGAFKESE